VIGWWRLEGRAGRSPCQRIGAVKLRPVDNPPNPYVSAHREWLEPPPDARIEVYEETSGSILSKNDSPDLPFTWSVNPYRGCQHACAYCYARTYHEYLGYGAGTDFDTKLVVKRNAPELLRKAFSHKRWAREMVNFSGVTDCYQPIEAGYQIMRGCLEVCVAFANPVAIVTKGFLVVRDIDLLVELDRRAEVKVLISIPFADGQAASLIEPQAPPPSRRFEAVRRLAEAGVPVGVFVAPVIPGLTDRDIPAILQQAAEAGARWASYTALRLPGSVEAVFVSRLRELMPLRADRVLSRLREIRGGRFDDSRFGHRMRGQGVYWDAVRELFAVSRARFGLSGVGRASSGGRCGSSEEVESMNQPARPLTQLSFDFE
jgi:DNA repair photolyase